MDLYDFYNFAQSIQNLEFDIPLEIFVALASLTNFVGYIMPFRLYIPIITLILSYWFLMIIVNAGKAMLSFTTDIVAFFAKFKK